MSGLATVERGAGSGRDQRGSGGALVQTPGQIDVVWTYSSKDLEVLSWSAQEERLSTVRSNQVGVPEETSRGPESWNQGRESRP